jgi:hypothetical protein
LSAIDYISSTNMVWLQGVEPIDTSNGFLNDGVLRLETVDDSYTVTLQVNGTITNSPSGLVEINLGAGGQRNLSSDWINLGSFNVNYGLNFSRNNLSFDQRGTFFVGLYSQAVSDGAGGFFNQNDGSMILYGKLRLKQLTFGYHGGSIEGPLNLVNSDLVIGSPALPPATFVFNGLSSGLQSNVPEGHSLIIQGDDLEGHSMVTSPNGFSNAGEITLDSTNIAADARLVVEAGTLMNLADGKIIFNPGAGGARGLAANVLNQGTLLVNSTANLSKNAGLFAQEGTLSVARGQIAYFYGANQTLEQRSGNIDIDGQLALNTASLRYLGGSIRGTPILYNSSLTFGAGATNPAAFYLCGINSRLLSSVPKGGTVVVLGSANVGAAMATSSGGFENRGLVRIFSLDGPFESGINVGTATLTNANGATLTSEAVTGGKRTIKGNLLNQGTLRMDAATPLTISGDLTQTGTGLLEVALAGPTSEAIPTALVTSNRAVLAGELKVTLPAGFHTSSSLQFPLVQASAVSGTFEKVTLPTVPSGFTWNLFYSPTAVSLNLNSPGSGTFIDLQLSGSQASIGFEAPDGGNFALLASTNLTSWISIQTNQAPGGAVQMIDPNYHQFKHRFYRVIPLP